MNELSWRERGRLWLRLGLRLWLTLLLLVAVATLGPTFLSLFAPFLLAGVCAWILSPAVKWLHKHSNLPRWFCALGVLLLVLAVLGGLLWALAAGTLRELVSFAGDWESILGSLEAAADDLGLLFAKWLELLPASAQELVNTLMTRFFNWLETVIPQLLSLVTDWAAGVARSLPSFAMSSVVFVMASYFLMSDYPRLRVMVVDKLPRGPRTLLSIVKRAVTAGFGGYIKAEFLLSVGVFFILAVGFFLIRQPYALLLALALAILDFIPIIGSGTAMVPWAAVDLLMGNFRHALGLMAVWGLVALFRRLGEPKILGNQTGLSPLVSLISVYVGMKLAGVAGMILGPVVCLVVRNVLRSGVLDDTLADLRLAGRDLGAILKGGREDPGQSGES